MEKKPSLEFCKTGILPDDEEYNENIHKIDDDARIEKCEEYYGKGFNIKKEGGRKKYKRNKSRKSKSIKSRKSKKSRKSRKSKRNSRR